eukprot:UN26289
MLVEKVELNDLLNSRFALMYAISNTFGADVECIGILKMIENDNMIEIKFIINNSVISFWGDEGENIQKVWSKFTEIKNMKFIMPQIDDIFLLTNASLADCRKFQDQINKILAETLDLPSNWHYIKDISKCDDTVKFTYNHPIDSVLTESNREKLQEEIQNTLFQDFEDSEVVFPADYNHGEFVIENVDLDMVH